MDERSDLVDALLDAFPDAVASFPKECWVVQAVLANQPDFSDAVESVTRGGGLAALLGRLRSEHPQGRPHQRQHDDRLLNVFTEAEAFAWAYEIAQLGRPEFVAAEGAPDLRIGDVWWVEAKTVQESLEEQQRWERIRPLLERDLIVMSAPFVPERPAPGLVSKFQSQFDDAVGKWRRQGSGQLIVFYCLAGVDARVYRDWALQSIVAWGRGRERSNEGRIVICYNHEWRNPVFASKMDGGTRE